MSIRYQHPNDELGFNPWISDGSDDGWWSGVQKCAATVAMAATLAISTFATSQNIQQTTWGGLQDDPAGSLHGFIPDEDYHQRKLHNPHLRIYSQGADGQPVLLFDEDYWQNSVPPVPASNLIQLPFVEKDDVPVGFFFGQPEEDFWQNPTPPVNNPSYYPQQFIFETNDSAGSLARTVDEDYYQRWQIRPTNRLMLPAFIGGPTQAFPPPLPPDEDYWQQTFVFPNHKVYGRGGGSRANTPDEDYWQQSFGLDQNYQVTVWIDESNVIQQPLSVDDNAQQNLAIPVQYSVVPKAFQDDEIWVPFVPTSPLPFDEEFWFNPVASISSYPVPRVFADDDILVPFTPFVPLPFDEETWQQQIELAPVNSVTFWIDDSAAVPFPALAPDEDSTASLVPPTIAQNAIPQYWTFDNQESAGSLYGLDEEMYWQNWVVPVPQTFGPIYLPDTNDDPAGSFQSLPEEFYWQNPVLPVQAINYVKLPLVPDPEEIPAGNLAGQMDEDFWTNPVQPVQATLGRIYLPDADDVSAGSFFVKPDEDYWINPVPPVSSYPVPFVYTDQEEIPAGSLYVHPDEDYWQNPVFPVPATFGKMYAMDLDDVPAGSFHGVYEDDSWFNPVRPISGYVPPITFSDDEITVPAPPLTIDEEIWQNQVPAVVATNYLEFPILPDPEEIPAGSLVPPSPPNPCPCSGIPNIPKDRVYDIVLCDQGIINNIHTWIACIFAQPNSLLAQHMGAPIVTLFVYGTQKEAFAQARQFVNHNMGTQ